MNTRIKIYIGLIVFFTAFLIYSNIGNKETVVVDNNKTTADYPVKKRIKPGDPIPDETLNAPKYLPVQIPANVLLGSKENDFYYYLFVNPGRKTVLYSYSENSKNPVSSQIFHDKIENAIDKKFIYGSYKKYPVTLKGMEIYRKNIFKDDSELAGKTLQAKGTKDEKELLLKVECKNAISQFISECAKTMCIINDDKNLYVKIDNRNVNEALQALKDYEKW